MAKNLPATWRAEKLQKKAAKAGFAWPDAQSAADKLAEEAVELQQALRSGEDPSEELGDVLFGAVSVAFQTRSDPEDMLQAACEKFIRRFSRMEQLAEGRQLDQLLRDELLHLWDRAKQSREV